jgi:hypothetical protein
VLVESFVTTVLGARQGSGCAGRLCWPQGPLRFEWEKSESCSPGLLRQVAVPRAVGRALVYEMLRVPQIDSAFIGQGMENLPPLYADVPARTPVK